VIGEQEEWETDDREVRVLTHGRVFHAIMGTNRVMLIVLCGLCMLAGVTCAFLGITGQQGVGFMGLAACLCLGVGGPGLSAALGKKPIWWTRTLVYVCSTLLMLGSVGMITLKLTGKDFGAGTELWHLNANSIAFYIACGCTLALAGGVSVMVHGIRELRTSDPLGPLDWNTQSERYRQKIENGAASSSNSEPTSRSRMGASDAAAQGSELFVAGISKVEATSLPPVGISVPDGVIRPGAATLRMTALKPVASSSIPYVLLSLIAIFAIGGAAGVWFFARGPRNAHASEAPVATAETLTFPEWGFGFDVPGVPFERIDPAEFSSRAVLAVTRKEPSMRFYVIAERRDDNRTLEESTRVLRDAMTDIAPDATSLLDSKAQLAGIDGWRLLTRVRVGATDTFYCHWLGELNGVSLQLWVVGTGRDAQSFAREADTLFDRFFLLDETKDADALKQELTQPAQPQATNASPKASDKPVVRPAPKSAAQPASKPAQKAAAKPGTQPATRTQPPKP
jgi:hypothetical protein